MSVFNIPVVIGVDEERIAKEIEAEVNQKVVDNITTEIKKAIYPETYRGRLDEDDKSIIKHMVERNISGILTKHESEIVERAAKYLAEKMARTKVVKEATKAVAEEALNGNNV